jgi:transposase
MAKSIRYVGLDVHAETISVAVAEGRGELRSMGTIPNRPESIRKLVKRLEPTSTVRVCYEAGPTGYALYWQLAKLGVKCEGRGPDAGPRQGRRSGEDGPA